MVFCCSLIGLCVAVSLKNVVIRNTKKCLECILPKGPPVADVPLDVNKVAPVHVAVAIPVREATGTAAPVAVTVVTPPAYDVKEMDKVPMHELMATLKQELTLPEGGSMTELVSSACKQLGVDDSQGKLRERALACCAHLEVERAVELGTVELETSDGWKHARDEHALHVDSLSDDEAVA